MANGMFGSIDANRGDPQNGWDTDQFPNSVDDLAMPMYEILRGGGFTTGGFNFDAKLRRQSTDRDDLFHAHIGGIDTLAKALLVAADMVEAGTLASMVGDRYAGWDGDLGRAILSGDTSLADLEARVEAGEIDPAPTSGRQELLRERRQPVHLARPLNRGGGPLQREDHEPRPRDRRLDDGDQGRPRRRGRGGRRHRVARVPVRAAPAAVERAGSGAVVVRHDAAP